MRMHFSRLKHVPAKKMSNDITVFYDKLNILVLIIVRVSYLLFTFESLEFLAFLIRLVWYRIAVAVYSRHS
jgi:hypothetical protein